MIETFLPEAIFPLIIHKNARHIAPQITGSVHRRNGRLCKTVETTMRRTVPKENIKVKRAYDPPSRSDGKRVLVDRLWPRGVKKAEAKIDEWIKDIAPSTALRKWFGHDPARWSEFQHRYAAEVWQHPEQLDHLRALARDGSLTLVFAAHDEDHNDAVVLRDLVLGRQRYKRS